MLINGATRPSTQTAKEKVLARHARHVEIAPNATAARLRRAIRPLLDWLRSSTERSQAFGGLRNNPIIKRNKIIDIITFRGKLVVQLFSIHASSCLCIGQDYRMFEDVLCEHFSLMV